jgi:hypothetical protein
MMYNKNINGLVTRCSSRKAKSAEPIGERALSMLGVRVLALHLAATKPKARSTNGFFAFCLTRQGALANNLHGLNPKNTAPITPVGKRRTALVWRLLKSKVQRWNKALLISEQTRHTHLVYFFKYMETDGLDLGLSTLGEPMPKRSCNEQ